MIGVSVGGHKFPPFVIFKGTENGTIAREINDVNNHRSILLENNNNNELVLRQHQQNDFPISNIYGVQNKAWMDEKLMLFWVERVWKVYTESINRPTLLILDVFRGHMTSKVKRSIELCGTIQITD